MVTASALVLNSCSDRAHLLTRQRAENLSRAGMPHHPFCPAHCHPIPPQMVLMDTAPCPVLPRPSDIQRDNTQIHVCVLLPWAGASGAQPHPPTVTCGAVPRRGVAPHPNAGLMSTGCTPPLGAPLFCPRFPQYVPQLSLIFIGTRAAVQRKALPGPRESRDSAADCSALFMIGHQHLASAMVWGGLA